MSDFIWHLPLCAVSQGYGRCDCPPIKQSGTVHVVIPDQGIDADYRVVVKPDETRGTGWAYTLEPVEDGQ